MKLWLGIHWGLWFECRCANYPPVGALLLWLDSLSLGSPRTMQWEKVGVRGGLDSYPIQVMVTLGLRFPIGKIWR